MAKRKLIGQILVEKNLVTEGQVNEALQLQKTSGKPLGNILVECGYITSSLITEALNLTQKREEQFAQLFNASINMVKEVEIESLIGYVIGGASQIIDAEMCTLYLVNEESAKLRSFIVQGSKVQERQIPLDSDIAGFVVKTGDLVNLADAYRSPLFDPSTDKETEYRTRTVLCIPLIDINNKIIGALLAINKKGEGHFSFIDEWLFKSYGSCAANAISVVSSDVSTDLETRYAQNLERIRLAVGNIPDGIVMICKGEDEVIVNPAARWLLGFEIKKDLNRENTLERLEGRGLKNIKKWLEDGLETLSSKEITIQKPESKVIKVDFAEIWASSQNEDKRGFVAILKDITKEKEVERIKSEFITIASHEFISPISSIKNAVSLLLQETLGPNTEPQKKFLKMVADSTEYLSYLSTTLMDLSLIEFKKMYLASERIMLSDIVRSVVDSTQFMAKEKGISVIVNDEDPPPVLADMHRTRQSMLALLDNAYKFTPNSGEIIIMVQRSEKEVVFSIKDNGIGISLDEQEKIFNRFYQVESSSTRENSGMGLGLSICKDIVTTQGGRLWVESKKGEGCKFAFTLPLYK